MYVCLWQGQMSKVKGQIRRLGFLKTGAYNKKWCHPEWLALLSEDLSTIRMTIIVE